MPEFGPASVPGCTVRSVMMPSKGAVMVRYFSRAFIDWTEASAALIEPS